MFLLYKLAFFILIGIEILLHIKYMDMSTEDYTLLISKDSDVYDNLVQLSEILKNLKKK
jgi:molybdate-binding protein